MFFSSRQRAPVDRRPHALSVGLPLTTLRAVPPPNKWEGALTESSVRGASPSSGATRHLFPSREKGWMTESTANFESSSR